jgi:hypothetical protein
MRLEVTRSEKLRGLRQLLDFLDMHPRLPVPTVITMTIAAENDLEGFEAMARLAHRTGHRVETAMDGTQRLDLRFGPTTYAIVYHPQNVGSIR